MWGWGQGSYFCLTMRYFLTGLWRVTKSGFYMTASYEQLSGWIKKLQSTSQSQTCTKRSWSLFGCLVPVWSTMAFWIPVKPLYPRSMLSKLIRCTQKNAIPAADIGQQNGPNSSPQKHTTAHRTTNASKFEWIGLQSFASSTIFTWLLANQLLFQVPQQLFAGKMLP